MAVAVEQYKCGVCRQIYSSRGDDTTCPKCKRQGIPVALIDPDSPAGVFRSDEDRERHHRREGQKGRA